MPTTTTGIATEFITFSRPGATGGGATVTDSDGRIKWAPHNMLLASEQFDASNYNKTNITVTANATAAPNGTTTADKVEATATASTVMFQATSAVNGPCTYSIWVKKGNIANRMNTWLVRNSTTATNLLGITVNYDTGVFIYDVGSSGVLVENAGSGWWKITMTVTSGVNSSDTMLFYQCGGGGVYTAGDYVFLWGAHVYRADLGGMQANTSAYPMYNPSTPKNLLGFTENFDNAAWTKNFTTVSANAIASPNGLITADKIVETSATNVHSVTATSITTVNGGTVTYSIYAKAAERSYIGLYNSSTSKGKFFNLANGTVGGNVVGAPVSASIEEAGNGFYRCSIVVTSGAATLVEVYLSPDGTALNYTGDGTSGIYLWGAQLSDSASLDPYSPNYFTAPSAAAYYGPRRDFDSAGVCRGLLVEEQRTNLLLHTAAFDNASWNKTRVTVTSNTATAPDGTLSADKIVEDTTPSDTHILSVGPTASAVAHSMSVYLKAAGRSWVRISVDQNLACSAFFDVTNGAVGTTAGGATASIVSVGNGWYRCVVSGTITASPSVWVSLATANGVTSYTGDGTSGVFVWGAQLEAGSFATSYIPTTTASATRSADVAQVGTAAFPYSQTEGTLVANGSFMGLGLAPSSGIATLSDGTSANSIAMFRVSGSSTLKLEMLNASSIQATYTVAMGVQPSKAAFAYAANNSNSALNGTAQTDDTTCTVPVMDRLLIGSTYAAGNLPMNGWVRQITYIPRRLSNAELQARTV